jgi:hypothetical protein
MRSNVSKQKTGVLLTLKTVTIIGVALVIMGVLGIAGAATADYTGLNLTQPEDSRDEAEFGWVQGVACAGGAMLALAGIAVAFVAVRKTRQEEEADMAEEIAAHEQQEKEDAAERVRASLSVLVPVKGPPKTKTQPQAESVVQNAQYQVQQAQTGSEGSAQAAAPEDLLDQLGKDLDIDTTSQLECPDCGEELEAGAKACPTCGAMFEEGKTEDTKVQEG